MQWVKNLTAGAQVAVKAQIGSPAWHSGLKDLMLLQLWERSQLWFGLSLAWELPYVMGAAIKTNKQKNYCNSSSGKFSDKFDKSISQFQHT